MRRRVAAPDPLDPLAKEHSDRKHASGEIVWRAAVLLDAIWRASWIVSCAVYSCSSIESLSIFTVMASARLSKVRFEDILIEGSGNADVRSRSSMVRLGRLRVEDECA